MTSASAKEFIAELEAMGIRLTLQGERIAVHFDEHPPSTEILEKIKVHKREFVDLLSSTTFPLSSQQQRLWFLSKLEEDTHAYFICNHFKVGEQLQPSLTESAFRQVILRHDILRTSFLLQDGQVVQRTISGAPQNNLFDFFEYVEWTENSTPENLDAALEKWTNGVALPLETGPLIRIRLVRTEDGQSILSVVIHHLICDALSLKNLFIEAIDNYRGLLLGYPVDRPALSVQYKDYVLAAQRNMANGHFEQSRAYWLRQFSTLPLPIDLPYKNKRPARKTYTGKTLTQNFDQSSVAALRKISQQGNCSFFASLYACVCILLRKYAGQDDLTLGTSIANVRAADREQIGLYVQNIALRLLVDPTETFLNLLVRSAGTIIDGLEHQDYPFELLIHDKYPVRDPGRSPLFDIMVDYFFHASTDTPGGLSVQPLKITSGTSKFDLTFTFTDNGQDLLLSIEYNTDFYAAEFIGDLCKSLGRLFEEIYRSPLIAIDDLDLFDSDDLHTPVPKDEDWSSRLEGNGSVTDLLINSTAPFANRIALQCGNRRLTYSWLREQSDKLAASIANSISDCHQKVIAILLPPSPEAIVSIWGILKAGAVFLPIHQGQPKEMLEYMLIDSTAVGLITLADRLFDIPDSFKGKIIAADLILADDGKRFDPPSDIGRADTAYLMYTSGSTGRPKAVEITHDNLLHYLVWASDHYFEEVHNPYVPLLTSIAFDLTITTLFTPLIRGYTLDILDGPGTKEHLEYICNSPRHFGFIKLTPSHLDLLRMIAPSTFPVDVIVCGGEELQERHIRLLRDLNPAIRIYNEYGPTETTVGCTVEEVGTGKISHSIGRPLPFADIHILNDRLQLLPREVWGEIFVGGKGVGKGYRSKPEQTTQKFVPDPLHPSKRLYRTGDRGRWRKDGTLECSGRLDDQIKFNGFRIEPGEVEKMATSMPGIDQCVVFLRTLPDLQKDLIAAYTSRMSISAERLREFLAGKLPAHLIPGIFVQLDTLPMTTNGKLDKNRIIAGLDHSNDDHPFHAPETPLQEQLAAYFRELLSIQRLGIDQNLFTIGLDSLKAVKAQSDLSKILPSKLEIYDLFSHPTIGQLGRLLDAGPLVDQSEQLPETIDL